MDILKLKFENCYGLKKFEHDFDFSHGGTHAIYAPNGAMKSSFAKIFDDVSKGVEPKDRVFKNRIPTVHIKCNHDDTDLSPERIFVIERYERELRYERVSTLLVNQILKDEYDEILANIENKQDQLIKNLQKHSGLKNNLIQEFTSAFKVSEKLFFETIEELAAKVNNDMEAIWAAIIYKEIFNDKVIAFLSNKDFKSKLDDYLNTYDELLTKSTYFKKGIFTHNNADTVSKSLKDNGFFKASHSVSLNSELGKKELINQEELDSEILAEKNKILTDEALSKKFKAMDDAITKNAELKNFRTYLENNPQIRPELRDIEAFKKKLWLSYLKVESVAYNELLEVYEAGKIEISRIVLQAKNEEAEWKAVVNMFNDRFKVPYKLIVKNQEDVILKNVAPSIVFEYREGDETEEIGSADLIDILSTGEQRALYLLNILFEIENRKKQSFRSLVIIDDIADSFDYRNKYAIVEYLKDMISSAKFRMIILTHNFDFFRTITTRLSINKWDNCFLTVKTELELKLVKGRESLEIFPGLKANYHKNESKLITAIPFVRNLIEYTIGTDSAQYLTLTGVLHSKKSRESAGVPIKGTMDICVRDLETIFNDVFKIAVEIPNPDKIVFELIIETAESICLIEEETINIENKIVLSIAIRLKAEIFMIDKLNDPDFTDQINSFQTAKLIKNYGTRFAEDLETKEILDRVNIMTPENIHLNSFMYEPILDLSDHHLKTLFRDVSGL
jgi:hypothetical protein